MAIVFIHAGYSPYLEFTLRQARAASPEAEIVLLGDGENDRFPWLTHINAASGDYARAARELAEVYSHRSTNAAAFEQICFERWFRLRAWFESSGKTSALVLDSDVMLYAPEAEVLHTYGDVPLAVALPHDQADYRWVAGPHATLWHADTVRDFCEYTLETFERPEKYDAKWAHHRDTGTPGGVCDMTALYLFAEERGAINVSDVRDGVAFDHNLNSDENAYHGEYTMSGGTKALTWDAQQRPWGHSRRLGKPVRFLGLHLQGHAKQLVADLYRGPNFKGQAELGASIRRYSRARAVAGRVKTHLWRMASRARGGFSGGGS